MREWIKVHPWKTEVVPVLMLLTAIVLPLVFRRASINYMVDAVGLSRIVWYVGYAVSAILLLAVMGLRIYSYHWWTAHEHRWRLNRIRAVSDPVIATAGVVVTTIFVVSWGGGFALLILVSAVLGAISWMITLDDELGRADRQSRIPEDIRNVNAAYLNPGEQFYLREVHFNWWGLSLGIALAVIAGFEWWMYYVMHHEIWLSWFLVTMLFAISQIATFRTVFTVTRSRVAARMGFHYVNIPIRTIRSCRIEELNAFIDYGGFGHRVKHHEGTIAFVSRSGQGLRIETIRGRKYLMTLRDAERSCELINAVIAATQIT